MVLVHLKVDVGGMKAGTTQDVAADLARALKADDLAYYVRAEDMPARKKRGAARVETAAVDLEEITERRGR